MLRYWDLFKFILALFYQTVLQVGGWWPGGSTSKGGRPTHRQHQVAGKD